VTTLYSSPLCDGMSVAVPNDASCVAGLGVNMNSQKVEVTKSASCEPAGGAPTGSVTPANTTLTTVCCLP
jgi:hypothetical protein